MAIDPRNIEVIDDETAAMFQRLSGPERVAMIDAMWTSACLMAEARLREQHPDWSKEELVSAAARMVTGASF